MPLPPSQDRLHIVVAKWQLLELWRFYIMVRGICILLERLMGVRLIGYRSIEFTLLFSSSWSGLYGSAPRPRKGNWVQVTMEVDSTRAYWRYYTLVDYKSSGVSSGTVAIIKLES